MIKKLCILIFILFQSLAFAAGPSKIAKSDRALWPYSLNTPERFDFASKMEMLVFAKELAAIDNYTKNELKAFVGIQNISMEHIEEYKKNAKKFLIRNFSEIKYKDKNDYVDNLEPNWENILKMAEIQEKKLPKKLEKWYADAKNFYNVYLYEQIRLAGLFHRYNSGILKLDNREINGEDEFADKQIILTFDDGPTKKSGNTDKLIELLKENNKTAVFFTLKTSFSNRSDNITQLYEGMTLSSHGTVHNPHTNAKVWADLIDFHDKIEKLSPADPYYCYFRPPYGIRTPELVELLDKNDCKVMLWNIDSQDWSSMINEKEMLDRLISLTLLWRSGIILFHDIHAKSTKILPQYWETFEGCGIHWD